MREQTDARRIMDAAWPEYGGNHQTAEFWQAFSEGVQFALRSTPEGGDQGAEAMRQRIATLEDQVRTRAAQRDVEIERANSLAALIREVPEALALWHERNDIIPPSPLPTQSNTGGKP